MKNWYVIKLIFRILSGKNEHQSQFDEQLRLVSAESEFQAMNKALQIGRNDEESFLNANKQTVKWTFIGISEILKLDSLTDGTELNYNIREESNPESYIMQIKKRAQNIEERVKCLFLKPVNS